MSSNKNKNKLNKHFESSSKVPPSRGTKPVKREKFNRKTQRKESNKPADRRNK